jgi:hypothetical protein
LIGERKGKIVISRTRKLQMGIRDRFC